MEGEYSISDTVGDLLKVYTTVEKVRLDKRLAETDAQVRHWETVGQYQNVNAGQPVGGGLLANPLVLGALLVGLVLVLNK
jgi:hypothetical protein